MKSATRILLIVLLAAGPCAAQVPQREEAKRLQQPREEAEIGPLEEMFRQAVELEREGKGAEAVRLYVRAARAGNAKAAKRLREIYDTGIRDDKARSPGEFVR